MKVVNSKQGENSVGLGKVIDWLGNEKKILKPSAMRQNY
jgi:hypothetical protein